jgi:hypothetical protein
LDFKRRRAIAGGTSKSVLAKEAQLLERLTGDQSAYDDQKAIIVNSR